VLGNQRVRNSDSNKVLVRSEKQRDGVKSQAKESKKTDPGMEIQVLVTKDKISRADAGTIVTDTQKWAISGTNPLWLDWQIVRKFIQELDVESVFAEYAMGRFTNIQLQTSSFNPAEIARIESESLGALLGKLDIVFVTAQSSALMATMFIVKFVVQFDIDYE
jgi:hypothetical protein